MLTDSETDAVCRDWHSKTEAEKDDVFLEVQRLRRMAYDRPSFHVAGFETWRLRSEEIARDISENWEDTWRGAALAIEATALEKLLFSQRVEAWERACQILQMATSDPAINADADAWSLFRNLRDAVTDEADANDIHCRRIVRLLVDDELRKQIYSEVGREHGKKPHVNQVGIAEKIRERWKTLQGRGASKNEAAPLIAKEVHLAPETVRKKLQGL